LDAGEHGRILREVDTAGTQLYGDPTSRVVFISFEVPGVHRLAFAHRRPWNKETLAHIDISIDSYGKEIGGIPRRERQLALAGVSM
jgi:hypothetical protein